MCTANYSISKYWILVYTGGGYKALKFSSVFRKTLKTTDKRLSCFLQLSSVTITGKRETKTLPLIYVAENEFNVWRRLTAVSTHTQHTHTHSLARAFLVVCHFLPDNPANLRFALSAAVQSQKLLSLSVPFVYDSPLLGLPVENKGDPVNVAKR